MEKSETARLNLNACKQPKLFRNFDTSNNLNGIISMKRKALGGSEFPKQHFWIVT